MTQLRKTVTMNNITFNWVSMQNFFSVGEEVRVDFNEFNGMNYVYGENKDDDCRNGSGKSTIFCDALLFALFNKTVKKLKKARIVNRIAKKKCVVKVNFSVNNRTYTVSNSIKPNEYKLIQHKDDGDEDLTKSSIDETVNFLSTEILNSSYLLFRNCLILSITNNTNIFEMTKAQKRNFLETMMSYSIIGEMFTNIKKDRNKLDKEITLKRQDIERITSVLEDFKEKLNNFGKIKKQNLLQIKKEIDLIKDQAKGIDRDFKNYKEDKETCIKQKDLIMEKIDKLKTKSHQLNTSINVLESEISNFDKVRTKYSKVLDAICNDCESKVNDILGIADISLNIDTKKNNVIKLNENKTKISDVVKDIRSNKLNVIETKISDFTRKLSNIENNLNKYQNLKKQIEMKVSQFKKEKDRKSDFDDLINKNKVELGTIKSSLCDIIEENKYLDFLTFFTSEDGFRKRLLSEYTNLLNNRIRKYLDEMNCGYTLILDDEFNYTFLTSSGDCDYENFSAGEKVRLNSACMFAFRDLLFGRGTLQSNLFICDEILDASVDEQALNGLVTILKRISKEQTVFVISHRESVRPEDFNDVVKIEKEHGYTKIIKNEV